MSHFIGTVQGSRGEAHRLGGKEGGMQTSNRGWRSGVDVYGSHNPTTKEDNFTITVNGGSNRTRQSVEFCTVHQDGTVTIHRPELIRK